MGNILFTLNLGKSYSESITNYTYPLLKQYAFKLGADFYEITERRFPEWPETYEKLQIYQLAQELKCRWAVFLDCDALINPDMFNVLNIIPKDTVSHNGADFAAVRWKYDRYFWRDGRNLGSATWFCIASEWCIELFKPLDDLTPEDVSNNIFPLTAELKSGMKPIRLVEDYVMSRNIAKYGLKFLAIKDLFKKYELPEHYFVWHAYAVPFEQKLQMMRQRLLDWGLEPPNVEISCPNCSVKLVLEKFKVSEVKYACPECKHEWGPRFIGNY